MQNILFYTFILLLLSINIFLIKRKRSLSTNKLSDTDQIKTDQNTAEKKHPGYEGIHKYSKDLDLENAFLKAEVLALGEELELSYHKSDKLNEQLADILGCLGLTLSYDEQLWDWSINLYTNELYLSEYGLRVRGYTPGTKLTWMECLNVVSDEYRRQVETALTISLNTGADFSMVYKIIPIDGGHERWVRSFGKIIYSADGIPVRLQGKFTFTMSAQMKP